LKNTNVLFKKAWLFIFLVLISRRITLASLLYTEGPEKELLQLAVFGELLALFPGVHIHIELVGPAIPPQRSDPFS